IGGGRRRPRPGRRGRGGRPRPPPPREPPPPPLRLRAHGRLAPGAVRRRLPVVPGAGGPPPAGRGLTQHRAPQRAVPGLRRPHGLAPARRPGPRPTGPRPPPLRARPLRPRPPVPPPPP